MPAKRRPTWPAFEINEKKIEKIAGERMLNKRGQGETRRKALRALGRPHA